MKSDATVARRFWWSGRIPGQQFMADLWDLGWAILLLVLGATLALIRKRSEAISYGVLIGLVAGTAAFTNRFSKIGAGPLYITEACMGVLAVTLGSLLMRKKAVFLPAGRAARWIIYFCLAYLSFGCLRLMIDLFSAGPAGLLAILRNFAIIYYAAFILIGWLLMQRSGTHGLIRQILMIVVVTSTLTSLWTSVEFLMGHSPAVTDPTLDASVIIQGQAAAFAMLSVIIITNVLGYGVVRRRKGLVICLLLLNVAYLYLSGHRSALLGSCTGVAMVVVSSRSRLRQQFRWSWVVVVILIAVVTWQFLSGYLVDLNAKFKTLLSPLEETNAAWRAAFWFAVVQLWLSSPFVGVGFSHDFYDEDPLRLVQAVHYDPHNSYLAILARSGAIGLGFLVAASGLFVWLMIRLIRSGSEAAVFLGSCLLGCFVGMGTFAAANVTLESPYHAMFFWLFIGMGVALAERQRSTSSAFL